MNVFLTHATGSIAEDREHLEGRAGLDPRGHPAPLGVRRVVLVEQGDSLVLRPLPDDPIGAALGSLAGPGPTTDEIREQLRAEELEAYERKGWQ
jgi:hypothetical protein